MSISSETSDTAAPVSNSILIGSTFSECIAAVLLTIHDLRQLTLVVWIAKSLRLV